MSFHVIASKAVGILPRNKDRFLCMKEESLYLRETRIAHLAPLLKHRVSKLVHLICLADIGSNWHDIGFSDDFGDLCRCFGELAFLYICENDTKADPAGVG